MNWSFPAAVRVIESLARRDWTATTWSLREDADSMAPHSDVASVRGMFQELGYADWQEAVRCIQVGWSGEPGDANRRKVYRYWVPREWQGRCARILRYAREQGVRPGHRPPIAALVRICEAEGQLALF